ncbi:MAG: DivIVA domain-containing protein [Micropruina sp.]|uniref:DivIVA domain-containing protein n=1 Tax=Micropruina sp. TaxID=2737536 RepID=UPI0039E23425
MSQQPEETVGLDLFDETASAAGSFPHSMLGYERQAVDAYIRDIERQLSSAKRKVRSLQRQLATKVDETDYSRLGTHTGDLLRAAEAQAAEMVKAAQVEAQRIVDDAANEAGQVTRAAQEGAAQARVSGVDDLNRLREQLAAQTGAELAAAQEQARALREAAENHRAMVLADAERNAAAMREQAVLEADQVKQSAQREAADLRAALAKEHSESLDALQRRQDEVTRTLSELADTARRQSEEFGAQLAADSALMDERRQKALAEAHQIVVQANEEGRAILSEARAKAAKLIADAELAASARADQLRRETERLNQRKAAIIGQLNSLSSLANSSVAEFPDDADEASADDAPTTELVLDDTAVEAAVPDLDDDATRVQPAVSGGGSGASGHR